MSHDLRQALGYRPLPASDATEQELRDAWHQAKTASESAPEDWTAKERFRRVDARLSEYLWTRASAVVEADRAKHPRAKRNAAREAEANRPGGRALP